MKNTNENLIRLKQFGAAQNNRILKAWFQ